MNTDAIANKLEALGLDTDEARIYVYLLQAGPSKVSDLVPYLDVSRTSLYRVLDTLCDRGYAAKSLDRPTTYEAQPPDAVFEMAKRKLQAQQDRIEDVQVDLSGPLTRLRDSSLDERDHHWKRLDGFPHVYETIQNLAGSAEERIQLVSNDPVTIDLDDPPIEKAWRLGATRVREDVEAQILLGFDEDDVDCLPGWTQLDNAEFRRFDTDRAVHFMLIDQTDVVVWAQPVRRGGAPEDAIALWTDAPGLVAPLSMLFDAIWANAHPVKMKETAPRADG